MADGTSLVLTSLTSSLILGMSAVSGFVRVKSETSAMTGYNLATEVGSDKVSFSVISLVNITQSDDLPALHVSAKYMQDVELEEVDLDVRFTSMPAGSELGVKSSEQALTIPRQAIKGKGVVGAPGMNLGKFDTDIDLDLWVSDPDALTRESRLELTFSKINGSGGDTSKKVLLQKFVIKLSV